MRLCSALLSLLFFYGRLWPSFAIDNALDYATWEGEIVIVVTWYDKDISWLTVLPEDITVRMVST